MYEALMSMQLGYGGRVEGALRAFVRLVCIVGGFMTREVGSGRKGLVAADIGADVRVLTSASALDHALME